MSTMITIVGKGGGGKSTIASNLATLLVKADHSLVAMLSCDLSYSSLPQFFNVQMPYDKSIAMLLQSQAPERMMQETVEESNIFVTGITEHDTCFTTEPPNSTAIELLFAKLRNVYDYVIVEANDPLINYMSAVAISMADVLINVIPGTVQGQRWQQAYQELLDVYAPKSPRINVLNKADVCVERKAFIDEVKTIIHYVLPYHVSIMQAESAGIPICANESAQSSRPVREFCMNMGNMAMAIIDGIDDLTSVDERSDVE